jgi:hypothetical protein
MALPEPKALPITKFAAAYGIHPSTVWRALREGRLNYVVVGKRKLVLLPVARKEESPGGRRAAEPDQCRGAI